MTTIKAVLGLLLLIISVLFVSDKDPLIYRMSWKEELLFAIMYLGSTTLLALAFLDLGGM